MEKTLFEQLTDLLDLAGVNYEVADNNGEVTILYITPKDAKKEKFENFVKELDNDLFGEVLEQLSEKYPFIEKAYSEKTDEMIKDFIENTKELVLDKSQTLDHYLSLIEDFEC